MVKVIDRGPFGRGRIIDLSWKAAKEIGRIAQGEVSVKVENGGKPDSLQARGHKMA
ncbi:septal ring lytic transglycosylase RlpA family protein [Segatella copri]